MFKNKKKNSQKLNNKKKKIKIIKLKVKLQ